MTKLAKIEAKEAVGSEYTPEQIQLIKRQIVPPSTTDDELKVFLEISKRKNLDPFLKQIYLTKRFIKDENKWVMTIITSIDGYRSIAARSGAYAGCDDIVYDREEMPKKATATVYKIVQGIKCSFTASAAWDEFVPKGKSAFMWNQKPRLMLGKVTEAQALRRAFPEELKGLYVKEEMDRANEYETVDVEHVESQETPVVPAVDMSMQAENEEAKLVLWQALVGKGCKFHGKENAGKAGEWIKANSGKPYGQLNAEDCHELLNILDKEEV